MIILRVFQMRDLLRVFQMRDHRCRSTGHHKNSRHPAFAGCREHMT